MNPGTDNIIEYGNPDADIILIQPSGDHEQETLENEAGLIRELSGTDFRFIGYMVPRPVTLEGAGSIRK